MQILGCNVRIQKKREAENTRRKGRNHLPFQPKCGWVLLTASWARWKLVLAHHLVSYPLTSCRKQIPSCLQHLWSQWLHSLPWFCLSFGTFWKGLALFSAARLRLRWLLFLAVSYSLQSRGMCSHRAQLQSMTLGHLLAAFCVSSFLWASKLRFQ